MTNFGASLGLAASVRGRSSRIELASSGAVMMKITTSTSITSTSGVMLISLMGWGPCGALEPAESHGSASVAPRPGCR